MKNIEKLARRVLARRRRAQARQGIPVLFATGLGAGIMYFLDPGDGARRRALVRDKTVHLVHRSGALFGKGVRDLKNRSQGVLAETKSIFEREEVSDERLEERVRAKLGRAVSHPHAIEVKVERGHVTLSGPVLDREMNPLLSSVAKVPGVCSVENQLEGHRRAAGVPSLQGTSRRTGRRFDLQRESWAPMTRISMGALGAGLVAYGISRRDRLGALYGSAGALVLLRDIVNRPYRRVLGIGVGRRAVDFQKTLTVNAPVQEVFELLSKFESFPRFMSHVKEVRKQGNERYHWTVSGPAHSAVSWDAEITALVPNQVIAWRSVPGSAIGNAGIIRLDENQDGSTRIDIRMAYNPPAGMVGHAVAALFGVDPKHALDEDMVRLQSLLERGKTTAHGQVVYFDELPVRSR